MELISGPSSLSLSLPLSLSLRSDLISSKRALARFLSLFPGIDFNQSFSSVFSLNHPYGKRERGIEIEEIVLLQPPTCPLRNCAREEARIHLHPPRAHHRIRKFEIYAERGGLYEREGDYLLTYIGCSTAEEFFALSITGDGWICRQEGRGSERPGLDLRWRSLGNGLCV